MMCCRTFAKRMSGSRDSPRDVRVGEPTRGEHGVHLTYNQSSIDRQSTMSVRINIFMDCLCTVWQHRRVY